MPGDPVILFNVWDAGSAKAVTEAGAKAMATGSASVAGAQGYKDAESLPLELALANADRVAAAIDLPVTSISKALMPPTRTPPPPMSPGSPRPARSAAISRIR